MKKIQDLAHSITRAQNYTNSVQVVGTSTQFGLNESLSREPHFHYVLGLLTVRAANLAFPLYTVQQLLQ